MESDLDMVYCGVIEVIGIDLNMGVVYDGHCSASTSTGAHATPEFCYHEVISFPSGISHFH